MIASRRVHRGAAVAAICAVLLALGAPVGAHFLLNTDFRIVHVEHGDGGLRLYIRLPMPLLVAGRVGPARGDGTAEPAPYTTNRIEAGQLMHTLDADALRDDPAGLGRLVGDGHYIEIDGRRLAYRVEAVRAHPANTQPRFSTLEEAKAAMEGLPYPEAATAGYIGDTVVDVALFYATDGPVDVYAFGSTLRPGIEGEGDLANMVLDYAGGETPNIYRAVGLLEQPITVDRSALSAAASFIQQGIIHIFGGIDHVLFVLCLTIGAVGLGNLLWRLTGFTLGHTVTLIAGFHGYGPQGDWFIALVEAAIALSIVYAGAVAVMRRPGAATFVVTATIGLLHGFGFSYVLNRILQLDSPNLWVSLLSFNIGVEIGQALIVLAAWTAVVLLTRLSPRVAGYGRIAVAVPCIAVAAWWTGDRVKTVVEQALT